MPSTPEAVIRQWFKEVWDEGNEEAIDRLMREINRQMARR